MGFESIIVEHRIKQLESRLAATDARLTALVEVLAQWSALGFHTSARRMVARLAALRAPGDATPSRAQSQVDELGAFILAEVDGEPSRSEGAVECAIRVIREHIAALATARRERDEAREQLETCRETISRQREMLDAAGRLIERAIFALGVLAPKSRLLADLRAWGKPE